MASIEEGKGVSVATHGVVVLEKTRTARGVKWSFSMPDEEIHKQINNLFQIIKIPPPDVSGKTDAMGDTIIVSTIAQKWMALFLALQQRICFPVSTEKENQDNRKRLLTEIVSGSSSTVAVIIAWSGSAIGTATIQYADHGNGNHFWINEVCKTGRGRPSPIPLAMNAANTYIKNQGAKSSWLMVEINPAHGFGAGLNSYYSKAYGYIMRARSAEHTIMELPLDGAPKVTQDEMQMLFNISTLAAEASKDLNLRGIDPKEASIADIPILQERYEKIIAELPSLSSMAGGHAESVNEVQIIEEPLEEEVKIAQPVLAIGDEVELIAAGHEHEDAPIGQTGHIININDDGTYEVYLNLPTSIAREITLHINEFRPVGHATAGRNIHKKWRRKTRRRKTRRGKTRRRRKRKTKRINYRKTGRVRGSGRKSTKRRRKKR